MIYKLISIQTPGSEKINVGAFIRYYRLDVFDTNNVAHLRPKML